MKKHELQKKLSSAQNGHTLSERDLPTTGFENRDGKDWTTIVEEEQFLVELAQRSERTTYSVVGQSVEQRPIYLVRVGYPAPPSDDKIATGRSILIAGTPHGNEPAGREMALQLMRDLAFTNDEQLLNQLKDVTILFMPTPNPDGREANKRGNAWEMDNNRDHLNLKSPEMQAMAKVMNEFQPHITVDAHERPSGSNPHMEMAWPRNLNIYEPLRHLSKEMIEDYLMPDVEKAGYTTGVYGFPTSSTNGNERVLSNMLGLRHSMGLITESAGKQPAKDRVEMQLVTAYSILRFYRERRRDVIKVVTEAPQYRAAAGAKQAPFYLDGSDNRTPPDWAVLDPAPYGYLLNTSQAKAIRRHIELFSLKTENVSTYGMFVMMNQPMMTVIPFLLDRRARYNEVDGLALYDCANPELEEPPLGSPSVVNLQILLERFEREGAFKSDSSVRTLRNHLISLAVYEDKQLTDKMVKHVKNFKLLLDYQRQKELVSDTAYTILETQADDLYKVWKHVFYYDFNREDGDMWDSTAFVSLDSWPRNPAGATYTIEEQTGKIVLDKRQQGNGSAYGRITPVMEEVEESELIIRFRACKLGKNQRIRFWIQADTYSTGSSMPVNGYGVELHLGTGQFILRRRNESTSTNLDSIPLNLTADWYWMRLRMHDEELSVRLRKDEIEEPNEWDMTDHLSTNERLIGKALLSFINFDYENGNTFYLDEIIVNDLCKQR